MKTAMQELIEEMQRIYTLPYVNGTTFMEGTMKYAKQLLEKEKEQIINAYNQNLTGFDKLEQEEIGLNWAEDYYNQTYKL